MLLLDARTHRFRDTVEVSPNLYAVLSHKWAHDAVTFQDIMLSSIMSKEVYRKITETCNLALRKSLKYLWIDTCCIDKLSSAALLETINSMFELYNKAAICFVYLQDFAVFVKRGIKIV
jgi:DNA integrity scanning protein DisA with diadenylate cyclase activity